MKRLVVFVLLSAYLAFNTGLMVYSHYCMGRFAGAELLVQKNADSCSKCGMEKNGADDNDCCKDEQTVVKITDDQQVQMPFSGLEKPVLVLANPIAEFSETEPIQTAEIFFTNTDDPPDDPGHSLLVKHCLFLI